MIDDAVTGAILEFQMLPAEVVCKRASNYMNIPHIAICRGIAATANVELVSAGAAAFPIACIFKTTIRNSDTLRFILNCRGTESARQTTPTTPMNQAILTAFDIEKTFQVASGLTEMHVVDGDIVAIGKTYRAFQRTVF
jgi:hypothetical protein